MGIVNQYHKAIFVSMTALAAGTIMSWNIVGGTLPKQSLVFPSTVVTANGTVNITTEFMHSWLMRLNYIGSVVGAMPTAFSAQQFGRKMTTTVLFMLFVLSWVLKLAADMKMLVTGMIVGGICIGAVSVVVPMYLCELLDNRYRGSAGSVYFAMLVLGQLITQATSKASYIWYTGVPLFFPPIYVITVGLAPESPPYLLYRQQPIEAEKALRRLRDRDIKAELEEMNEEMTELSTRGGFIKDMIVTKAARRGFIASCLLMVFLALCGAAQIQRFIADFYGADDYYALNLANLAVQVVFSLLAGRLSDSVGKRTLLIASAIGMSISLIVFGIYYNMGNEVGTSVPAKIFVFVFIVGYSVGFGPLPWIFIMEVLPINVKWVGCSLAITLYWLVECLFQDVFSRDIEDSVGKDAFMWIQAGICALAAVCIFLIFPETKKLSFGEIREVLESKTFSFWKNRNVMNMGGYYSYSSSSI